MKRAILILAVVLSVFSCRTASPNSASETKYVSDAMLTLYFKLSDEARTDTHQATLMVCSAKASFEKTWDECRPALLRNSEVWTLTLPADKTGDGAALEMLNQCGIAVAATSREMKNEALACNVAMATCQVCACVAAVGLLPPAAAVIAATGAVGAVGTACLEMYRAVTQRTQTQEISTLLEKGFFDRDGGARYSRVDIRKFLKAVAYDLNLSVNPEVDRM